MLHDVVPGEAFHIAPGCLELVLAVQIAQRKESMQGSLEKQGRSNGTSTEAGRATSYHTVLLLTALIGFVVSTRPRRNWISQVVQAECCRY